MFPTAQFAGKILAPCHATETGDFVVCPAVPVAVAEEMLNTKYHAYVHSAAGWGDIVRADSATGYSLPASVAAHVDFVSPTLRFPLARTGPTAMRANAPLRTNTPATLRQLYKVGHTEGNSTTNKQSCTAFLGQFYKPADLTKFWTKCVAPASARAPPAPSPLSPLPRDFRAERPPPLCTLSRTVPHLVLRRALDKLRVSWGCEASVLPPRVRGCMSCCLTMMRRELVFTCRWRVSCGATSQAPASVKPGDPSSYQFFPSICTRRFVFCSIPRLGERRPLTVRPLPPIHLRPPAASAHASS